MCIAVRSHCQMNENYVQNMRLMYCLNMDYNLKTFKMSTELYYMGKCCDQNDHFADDFVLENVVCGNDFGALR